MTAVADLAVGDTVIVAARGPWFGHTGTITRVARSQHTDLALYQVPPATDLFYADELAPQPAANPEWQVPDGPARDLIILARKHGWVVHVAPPMSVALISPPDRNGVCRRVYASTWGGTSWIWTVETFNPAAQPTGKSGHIGTVEQLEQLILQHGHKPCFMCEGSGLCQPANDYCYDPNGESPCGATGPCHFCGADQ